MYIQGGTTMVAQVKSWGNSQGIRLPKELLELAKIEKDDFLTIELMNGNIILKKTNKHRTLEERAEVYGGKLGPYTEFDWGESIGRERW